MSLKNNNFWTWAGQNSWKFVCREHSDLRNIYLIQLLCLCVISLYPANNFEIYFAASTQIYYVNSYAFLITLLLYMCTVFEWIIALSDKGLYPGISLLAIVVSVVRAEVQAHAQKSLVCQNFGQNLKIFGQRNFDIFNDISLVLSV